MLFRSPIANSVAEMYTETRYLRPDLLEAAGIEDFDQWAATFGDVVSGIEVAPDGSGFRMRFVLFTVGRVAPAAEGMLVTSS